MPLVKTLHEKNATNKLNTRIAWKSYRGLSAVVDFWRLIYCAI